MNYLDQGHYKWFARYPVWLADKRRIAFLETVWRKVKYYEGLDEFISEHRSLESHTGQQYRCEPAGSNKTGWFD